MKRILGILAILSIAGAAGATELVDEDFTYPDGALTNVAVGTWAAHSGTTGADVSGNALSLSASSSMDVNTSLGGTYSSGTVYYKFELTMTAQPTATGSYLAHLKDGASNFRDRVYAKSSGAGFVLGVSTWTETATFWATVLDLSTPYTVVVGANLGTDTTTLWIDPLTESSTSISSTAATTSTATQFAFRQASGIGTMTIDDLAVATTFNEVVPEPATAGLLLVAGLGFAFRRLRTRE